MSCPLNFTLVILPIDACVQDNDHVYIHEYILLRVHSKFYNGYVCAKNDAFFYTQIAVCYM